MNFIRRNNDIGISDLTDAEKKTIAAFVINNERIKSTSKYLEVGVWAGGTIQYMKEMTKTTQLTGIDLFEDLGSLEKSTHGSGTYMIQDVQNFLGKRARLIKGNSSVELNKLTEKFDHIFIDGDHSYDGLIADFDAARKILAPNGQISFHNCSTHIWPDFAYVQQDGGPWLVAQELKASKEWRLAAEVERVCVFVQN